MRRLAVKTLLALAVVLLAAEAILRWGVGLGNPPLVRLDPETEYELIGPAEYTRWGNRISINASGLRADSISPPAPSDRRLLLIGDSVIYGGHFIDQSETIAAQTATYLSTQDCQVTVLPIAASSWGPVNQAAFLRRNGTFDATAAGIVVSAHDLYDTPQNAQEMLPYRTATPLTALHDAATIVLERLFRPQSTPPEQPIQDRARATLAALDQITTQLRAAGITPILFYHPTMAERANGPRQEATIFASWAAAQDVQFADLSTTNLDASTYQDDIHPNALGTKKLASFIGDLMRRRGAGCD